ncbi:MAG: peroxidase-related enzyme [Pseudomonadota bacterium]
MTKQLPSLSQAPNLTEVFTAFPRGVKPMLEFLEVVLREKSSFTRGERELMAAHVSSLNACAYCFGSHAAMAQAFGVAPDLLESLRSDPDNAPIAEKLKPVIRYVSKLTLSPSRMSPVDAQAVYDAGWDEHALYDAILVCAAFNMMNRIVDGTGCVADIPANAAGSEKPFESYIEWGKTAGFFD